MAVTYEMRRRPRVCPSCGGEHRHASSDRCVDCMRWERRALEQYRGQIGGVYFVKSGEFVKIGVSDFVVLRVSQSAWMWNPHDVTPLGWIPEPDNREAYRLEERVHREFASDHHRGEWFHASARLLTYIAENAEEWPRRPVSK